MLLTEFEKKVQSKLAHVGLRESYPFIENSYEQETNSMESVFYHAVCAYQTFQPVVDHNHHYSENELKLLALLLNYQQETDAYYSNFNSKRLITMEDIEGLSHDAIKGIIHKANKKNRGLYFLSSLKGYTSTTLYENPEKSAKWLWMDTRWHKSTLHHRVFGKLSVVLPKTLLLYNGTVCSFDYPYSVDGKEWASSSIYEVYDLACKHKDLELLNPRKYYSGQQKKNIKRLKQLRADGFFETEEF